MDLMVLGVLLLRVLCMLGILDNYDNRKKKLWNFCHIILCFFIFSTLQRNKPAGIIPAGRKNYRARYVLTISP